MGKLSFLPISRGETKGFCAEASVDLCTHTMRAELHDLGGVLEAPLTDI